MTELTSEQRKKLESAWSWVKKSKALGRTNKKKEAAFRQLVQQYTGTWYDPWAPKRKPRDKHWIPTPYRDPYPSPLPYHGPVRPWSLDELRKRRVFTDDEFEAIRTLFECPGCKHLADELDEMDECVKVDDQQNILIDCPNCDERYFISKKQVKLMLELLKSDES